MTTYATINVMHLFGMKLDAVKDYLKMEGFHHEYLGELEKTGAIKLKIIEQLEGFYKTQIWINDIPTSQPKTFFPKHWTREEVVQYVADVYNDTTIKKGIMPELQFNGKFKLIGSLQEGIDIYFWINQQGKILSVYPILNI